MSNLLDKASIILTPTAYNNGEALCVKPSDGSGDFDFSRNSAATRVNAQGLVENVQILSSNLVQNGDFSEEGAEEVSNGSFSQEGSELVTNGDFATDSDWVKGNGITIDGGKANFVNSTGDLRQDPVVENGKYYKVTYTISNYVSGSVRFEIPSNIGSGIERSANGTYTEILLSSGTAIQFDARTSFTGSIDNVSVREVGQDWTLGTGWSIAEDKATFDETIGGAGNLSQSNILTVSKTYKLTFDTLETNGGNIAYSLGSSYIFINAIQANTTYTVYGVSEGTQFTLRGAGNFNGSITNISVKEVAQDWENPVYSGDNSASLSIDNGALKIEKNADLDWRSSFVSQTPITYVSGKTYKITYSLKDGTTSGADVYVRTNFDRSANTVNVKALTNDWVEYTDYYVADTSADDISFGVLAWQNTGSGQYYFIDNISVIEITTDTSLPRINYEGFSYDGSGNVVPDSGCGSWLWEPQTTQLVPYSEDFSQYATGSSAIVTGGFLAPDGTNNAYKITNSGSSTVYLSGIPNLSSTSTRSIYARSVSGTGTASLMSYFGNTNNLFTLTEQWQRFEVNVTTTITGESNFYAADFRGSGTLTEYLIWGANATNDQDYATSYIPSNGSSVTRNQDLCTNGGSLASINSTEGVLYAEIAALVDTDVSDRVISLSDNTITNRVELKLTATGSIQGRFDSATSDTTLTKIGISTTNTNKIALYWESGKCALWINGIKEQENLTFNTFASNALIDLSFNSAFSGGSSNFFGKTKCLAVFPILTDAELTELTTI